eukprot:c11835_g2_i1.p1 GENE.c11835_g2_i1~~c11835_g2_i1.p1  ORF type:complete len:257 (-),score=51.53 c11835_g2_i1:572-1342(-)
MSKYKESFVAPENAIQGRDTPLEVANHHFVLATPIKPPFPEGVETCVFGTGCFWGAEKGFWRLPGVFSTAVGYAAGITANPTYKEVCSGNTNHNEVVLVAYDSSRVSFIDVLRQFWQCHDPTQGMGQGHDRGTQYRSGIYPSSPTQHRLAIASRDAYQKALKLAGFGPITTEIAEPNTTVFYYAEDYHQQYLSKPATRPYCSAMPTTVSLPALDLSGLSDISPATLTPKLNEEYWAKYAPTPECVLRQPNPQVVWP